MRERGLRGVVLGALAAVAAALAGATAHAAPPPAGALTQLPGVAGCIDDTGDGVLCAPGGPGFSEIETLQTSPDGRYVYALTLGSAVLVYARDAASGALTQLPAPNGCLAPVATPSCTTVAKLDNATDMRLSPDGAHLVVIARSPQSVVLTLVRDAGSGRLSTIAGATGCISESGSLGTCENGRALGDPRALAFSPDGAQVYVASFPSHVAVLTRNAATGDLSQAAGSSGCISDDATPTCVNAGPSLATPGAIAVSPDGKRVWVSSLGADAIAVLVRQTSGALGNEVGVERCLAEVGDGVTCRDGQGVDAVYALAPSLDDAHVYAADTGSSSGLTALRRTAGGGLELVARYATDAEVLDAAVSADGAVVYAAGGESDVLYVLARDATTGALAQLPPTAGCVSRTGSGGVCAIGFGLAGTQALSLSPDARHLYAGAAIDDAALAAFARSLPPSCAGASVTVTAGVPTPIALSCSDPNGDPVERAVQQAPQHGALGSIAQVDGTVTYFPADGYLGADAFTFAASDGTNASGAATISIDVVAPGTAPPPPPPTAASDTTAPLVALGKGPIRLTARGVARLRLTCPAAETSCAGKVSLLTAKALRRPGETGKARRLGLGNVRYALAGGAGKLVSIRLSAANRALLAARGSLRVVVTVRATDAAGNRGTTARTLTFLPPRQPTPAR
ncbi:MAG: beta-propeller fold lactonase family protein [Thermoleophilia bacterium]